MDIGHFTTHGHDTTHRSCDRGNLGRDSLLRAHKPEQALACGQPRKFPLQLIHSIEIELRTVIAAPLLRGQSKATGDVCVARAGSAEMN